MNTGTKVVASASAVVAGVYLLACGFLAVNARALLYHPAPRDPATPHWTLQRDDARILISSNQRQSPHLVLYFGGNAEDVAQTLPLLERAFPDAGIHAMHYRGYGGSSGMPSESALIADAFSLYDTLAADAGRITVIGRSLGSGVAVQLAAARTADRLVLVTPYGSIAGLAARMFSLFPVRWLLRDHYESWRFAGHIRAPSTLIIAGRDTVIPNDSSLQLARHFRPGLAEVITFADADHSDITRHPQFVAALRHGTAPVP